MKLSCEIIKDLLPLYHDSVCSENSKIMIEEHLEHCENCRDELQAMDSELPITSINENLTEAEAVKKLSRRWKKGMYKSLLKGALITLLVLLGLFLVFSIFFGIEVYIS